MKYKCPKCGKEYAVQVVCCCDPDAAVVERFNELVKEGKIEYSFASTNYTAIPSKAVYRLRPTPRYRPYNTSDEFKLADFCGKRVRGIGNQNLYTINTIGHDIITIYGLASYTWEKMFDRFVWADTGEPFGIRVE